MFTRAHAGWLIACSCRLARYVLLIPIVEVRARAVAGERFLEALALDVHRADVHIGLRGNRRPRAAAGEAGARTPQARGENNCTKALGSVGAMS